MSGTFINWEPPPKTNCRHTFPVTGGKDFGVGTIWRCNECGQAFVYKGVGYDQRDRDEWPKWERAAAFDGPDRRPQAQPPPGYQTSRGRGDIGLYAPGTK